MAIKRIITINLYGIGAMLLATFVVACGGAPTQLPPTVQPTQVALTPTVPPTTYDDPFAYCAVVGDIDKPDARYVGPQAPEAIAKALQKATGAAPDAPLDWFIQGTFWRCAGGKVYGCFVGANIPCWSKANTDRTPTEAEIEFCKTQPNADNIPAAVTGHETIYEWGCKNGTPEIVRQVLNVDARGFVSEFWYELSPEK